jgi:hypothetical protein
MKCFFVVGMDNIKWREARNILCKHEAVNQVNNNALHNISTKITNPEK